MTQIAFNERMLQNREEAFVETPQVGRPFLAGWVSANCQQHRSRFFDALVAAAGGVPELAGTVNALGPCDHNTDWSETDPVRPASLAFPNPTHSVYGPVRDCLLFTTTSRVRGSAR
jgi:hypothetical protein